MIDDLPKTIKQLSNITSFRMNPIKYIEDTFIQAPINTQTLSEIEYCIIHLCHLCCSRAISNNILMECLTRLTQARNLIKYQLENK